MNEHQQPAQPAGEPLQPAEDEALLAISARLIEQNREAYEVLAQ